MAKTKPFDPADIVEKLQSRVRLQSIKPDINGYQPHRKQEMFHSSTSKGRLYIGGNRSGKSTGGIVEDIWWATGKHPYIKTPEPPIEGRIIGVDFLNGIEKIILPQLARWIPLSELKGGAWTTAYAKGDRILTFENGSTIDLMSYDQDLDKFAGVPRHFVHMDEEPPQDIFLENKTRLIDYGGSWWMTLTPVEGMTWIYDDIYMPGKSNPLEGITVIEVDMTDNPYLSPGEVQEYILGLSEDDKLARVHGKFVQVGGLVYKTFDPDIHVIDPMMPPQEWEWYCSLDHGYNNPTAILWHAVSGDGQVITFSEHYERERTVDYHASVIHSRNANFGRVPDLYVADPAIAQRNAVTGTSIQQEYSDNGVPFNLGNNDVLSGVNRINHYLQPSFTGQPRWTITRNCVNLIWEMQRLKWKVFQNKKLIRDNNRREEIHKKDDHACDSARYFFTMLPDLSPILPGEVAQPHHELIAVRGVEPVSGRYDELLIKSLEQQKAPQRDPYTEWDYEYGTTINY